MDTPLVENSNKYFYKKTIINEIEKKKGIDISGFFL